MSIPAHEEIHYMTVKGGSGDLTGAVLHVTRPAAGLDAHFAVQKLLSDDGETKTYSMTPYKTNL